MNEKSFITIQPDLAAAEKCAAPVQVARLPN